MEDVQSEIQSWFNKTYRTRGVRYLRPVEAYELFITLLEIHEGMVHLDVACGPGLLLKQVLTHGAKAEGIDLSDQAIQMARQYVPDAGLKTGNAEQIPYESGLFDTITCIGSMERFLDRERALNEMLRVGKPDARYCFMVRNAENFTWNYLWKPLGLVNKKGHQDALNLSEWKSLFESSGFEILNVLPDHWPYLRLIKTILPWKTIDYGRIRRFPGRLQLAYEFIFFLKKRD